MQVFLKKNDFMILILFLKNSISIEFRPLETLKMDLRIVSGSSDNTIKIWDALTGQLINTLTGHHNYVSSVAFSPDNSKIVSGSDDHTVKILDDNKDPISIHDHQIILV